MTWKTYFGNIKVKPNVIFAVELFMKSFCICFDCVCLFSILVLFNFKGYKYKSLTSSLLLFHLLSCDRTWSCFPSSFSNSVSSAEAFALCRPSSCLLNPVFCLFSLHSTPCILTVFEMLWIEAGGTEADLPLLVKRRPFCSEWTCYSYEERVCVDFSPDASRSNWSLKCQPVNLCVAF